MTLPCFFMPNVTAFVNDHQARRPDRQQHAKNNNFILDNRSYVLYNINMNAWEMIWRELKTWLQRKRFFAMDVEALESLRLIAEREQCSPQEAAERLFKAALAEQDLQDYVFERWQLLSPRERQIAALVCRNYTSRQIAAQLKISPTTVKTHAENILRKFNARNRQALRQLLSGWDLSAYE